MSAVRKTVLERSGCAFERRHHVTGSQDRTEGNIAGRKPLAQSDDVRIDFPVVDCKVRPRSTEPGHYLVDDEEDTIFGANFSDALPIGLAGDSRTQCRTDYRFCHKGHDVIRTVQEDGLLELVG